ncbi:MAG: hypothetical protein COB04_17710 [Gammaproteobacteria bacterium]|nr:MAG: hypothetical protein COB04_17710 [Gammaproteobacteria bacterium]
MTLTEIQSMIDFYIAGEKALTKNASYSINGRSYTRADLGQIRKGRQEWEQRKASYLAIQQGASNNYSVVDFS